MFEIIGDITCIAIWVYGAARLSLRIVDMIGAAIYWTRTLATRGRPHNSGAHRPGAGSHRAGTIRTGSAAATLAQAYTRAVQTGTAAIGNRMEIPA